MSSDALENMSHISFWILWSVVFLILAENYFFSLYRMKNKFINAFQNFLKRTNIKISFILESSIYIHSSVEAHMARRKCIEHTYIVRIFKLIFFFACGHDVYMQLGFTAHAFERVQFIGNACNYLIFSYSVSKI